MEPNLMLFNIQGISTNFKLASLLTLARFTVKNFYLLKNPFNFVIAFFKTFKPDVFLFMMGYTGIYRVRKIYITLIIN